jgi:cell division protein FtsQ
MMKKNARPGNSAARWKQSRREVKVRSDTAGAHIGRYIILLGILGAGMFFGMGYMVKYAEALPVFTVRKVIVEGTQYINRDKIIETAGIKQGKNLFDVNLPGVSRKLNMEFTARDFTIFRKLPDTIVIRVLERKPVALLNSGKLIGVDEDGVPLPHVGADMVSSLPIITGIKSGESLSDPKIKASLQAGIKLLGAITKDAPSVQKRISEVNIATMGINLIDNGLDVIIGDTDWAEKVPFLDKVISEVTSRNDSVKTINLKFYDQKNKKIVLSK